MLSCTPTERERKNNTLWCWWHSFVTISIILAHLLWNWHNFLTPLFVPKHHFTTRINQRCNTKIFHEIFAVCSYTENYLKEGIWCWAKLADISMFDHHTICWSHFMRWACMLNIQQSYTWFGFVSFELCLYVNRLAVWIPSDWSELNRIDDSFVCVD